MIFEINIVLNDIAHVYFMLHKICNKFIMKLVMLDCTIHEATYALISNTFTQ